MKFQCRGSASDDACFWRLPVSIFLCYLTVGLPLPVISLFVHQKLGLNSTLVGVAVGIQFLATVSTRGYAGRTADTRGAKRTTLAGMFSCGGAGLFYLLAALLPLPVWPRYGILLVGRLLLGYGESQMLTGVLVWGFGLLGPARAGVVMSWNGMAIFGALAAGAPLGLMLYGQWGFAALGVSTLVLPFLSLPLLMRIRATEPVQGERPPLRQVIGRVWLPCTALFLQGIGFAVIGTFAALYFADNHWGHAGLALTCFGGAFVLVRVFWGKLPDTLGGIKVSQVSFAVEASGLLLLWLAPHPSVAFLGAVLTGAGTSLLFPALGVEVVKIVPPNVKGTAIGGFAAFQDIAYALGGPATGALAAVAGYPSVFLAAAVCAALGLGVTEVFRRSVARQDS
ncbi:MAG: MFS transporter [Pseudodesulfovibrio sp.]|uniref:MFS transporter n=1 Tax=Pseudodesulfovibrio sp. TaxID=2035812 RepID=UPI003D136279